jgi:predicted PurR-regulated permease PerM
MLKKHALEDPMPNESTKRTILFAIAAVAVAIGIWALLQVILLLFASILVALALSRLARWVQPLLRDNYKLSLSLVLIFLVTALGGTSYFFGAMIAEEISRASTAIPQSLDRLRKMTEGVGWAQTLIDQVRNVDLFALGSGFVPRAFAVVSGLAAAAASTVVVIVSGIYLGFGGDYYRDQFLALMPPRRRPGLMKFASEAKQHLQGWLVGQLILMVSIGVTVAATLAVIGVPSPIALGLFAGLVEFVPYFGPFISATASVLVAITAAPELALWTIGAFVIIQQLENNLLQPLVMGKAAALPAVVVIFAVIAFTFLFGFAGTILAVPLAITVAAAVRCFYDPEKTDA